MNKKFEITLCKNTTAVFYPFNLFQYYNLNDDKMYRLTVHIDEIETYEYIKNIMETKHA